MKEPYAIGIPTRGRRERLIQTLRAIAASDNRPELVVVIDNNDEPMAALPPFKMRVEQHWRTAAEMHVRGDAHGSALALGLIKSAGFHVGVKWDDDLEPLPACLGTLVHHVFTGNTAAAGGMYYRTKAGPCCHYDGNGMIYVPDGNPRHLQFFQWSGAARLIPRMHLYSSFAYDVAKVEQVGGFCELYSRASYRHETDLTLRLSRKYGPLLVDTSAEAAHWLDAGGLREMSDEEYRLACRADNALFLERMNEMRINAEY